MAYSKVSLRTSARPFCTDVPVLIMNPCLHTNGAQIQDAKMYGHEMTNAVLPVTAVSLMEEIVCGIEWWATTLMGGSDITVVPNTNKPLSPIQKTERTPSQLRTVITTTNDLRVQRSVVLRVSARSRHPITCSRHGFCPSYGRNVQLLK